MATARVRHASLLAICAGADTEAQTQAFTRIACVSVGNSNWQLELQFTGKNTGKPVDVRLKIVRGAEPINSTLQLLHAAEECTEGA